MFDIRAVSAKIALRVSQMAPLKGFIPPSIVILGDDLDKTTEIFYNDLAVEEFLVQSKNRLIAKLPSAAIGKPFTNLRVLSNTYVSTKDAALELKLHNPLQRVSGMDRLVQTWVMTFLTTPGSSVFDKSSGGGGQSLVGRQADRDGRGVSADLTLAIERTKNEILTKQGSARNIPADERLLSADLEQVSFDPSTGTLIARVSLRNMVGASAEVSLG